MQTELIRQLNQVLNAFPEYWDNEKLQRAHVINDIKERKPDLIKALIHNAKIKSLYSTEIDGVLVFDFHALTNLLQYKEYWADSFTKYRNSVGLTSEGKNLNYNSDVVLDFPFKDCVLEGGMTREEQGKDEVYYNEIIARDEIDRLFSPKVLTNVKRYSNNGVEENITDFSNEDNLIIKGNNLIALHSLKERYAGKVKLIYIDPPYNTGNDSFKYNDRFNRSTWLTFMKNRLEVARHLLSDDGAIFINIDDGEVHYLKVLIDSIFNEDNFVSNIIWQKKYTIANDARYFSDNHDHILVYAKNKNNFIINGLPRTNEMNDRYKNIDNDPRGAWMTQPLHAKSGKDNKFSYTFLNGVTWVPPRGTFSRYSKESLKLFDENNMIWFGKENTAVPRLKKYLSEMGSITPETIWLHTEFGNNDQANREIKTLIDDYLFSTPKPEKLLQKIIHIGSNENDIILDFHLGSGTTAAVAHKMGRRYIGVEQMDYINDITVPRLQKVIEGEQGGISKDVNWQGGGSFVYAELKELNYTYIHQIQSAKSYDELAKLFEVMKQTAHLNYQVELDKILNDTYEVNGIDELVTFKDLTVDEQKRLLIELLDKNQLYVNADDMNDTNLKVSEQDKAFTRGFYGKGK